MSGWIVALIIIAVLIAIIVVMYFLSKKMMKKQEEQQAQIDAAAQTVIAEGRGQVRPGADGGHHKIMFLFH